MKETELKPCPFCGGEAKIKMVSPFSNDFTAGFNYVIKCKKCGLQYPHTFAIGFYLTDKGEVKEAMAFEGVVEQSKELWNRRTDDEQRAD